MRTALLIPLLGAFLIAGAACASDRAPAPGPVVVATIPPVASLVRAVTGDAVRVRTLLPPGAHPDTYEPTPRTAQALAGADLVIRVGGAADAWLGPVEGVPEVVLTDGMRLHGQRGAGTGNPHVWLDPIRVRDVLLPKIVAGLADALPDSAASFRSRAAAFADSLTALDAEIRKGLRAVESRRFIGAHPAWAYFAERYDLVEVGTAHGPSGTELSPRELARLVDEVRGRGATAVIIEPQLGRAGVQALAQELDATVAVADPLGGADIPGRHDYLSLMRFNGRAFARALGGS